jgi:hypothetical protein
MPGIVILTPHKPLLLLRSHVLLYHQYISQTRNNVLNNSHYSNSPYNPRHPRHHSSNKRRSRYSKPSKLRLASFARLHMLRLPDHGARLGRCTHIRMHPTKPVQWVHRKTSPTVDRPLTTWQTVFIPDASEDGISSLGPDVAAGTCHSFE